MIASVDRRITVYDPSTRTIEGEEITVRSSPPPSNWWPWIVAATALAGAWWMSRRASSRPLAGAAG